MSCLGIQSLINVSKKCVTNINKLIDNGKEITDPNEMADTINNFYVDIAKTIEQKIPKDNKLFDHYLGEQNMYNKRGSSKIHIEFVTI